MLKSCLDRQTGVVTYVEGSLGKQIKPSVTFWDNVEVRRKSPFPFFLVRSQSGEFSTISGVKVSWKVNHFSNISS